MSVNEDSVLRSVYYKYVHPKEVFIAEGVLVPDIARKKNTATLGGVRKSSANKGVSKPTPSEKLPFVYPYGASINVQVNTAGCSR
jgi:intraflagellar transport protein 52